MFRYLAPIAFACLTSVIPAWSQSTDAIWVPSDVISYDRSLNDDEITVCLNKASALVEFDRSVAQAIADILLLNVRFEELVAPVLPYKYDFRIPFASTDLFVQVTNKCQAMMGVRLSPGIMPSWMTVSAPYYHTRSVIAVRDPNVDAFDKFAGGAALASRMGAPGDTQLTSYIRSLAQDMRPKRVPYPDNETVLQKLQEGAVAAAFIWEPALTLASQNNPASLGVAQMFDAPFSASPIDFAVAFPIQDSFTRGLFDDALRALIDDGVIDQLIAEHGLPPSLVP